MAYPVGGADFCGSPLLPNNVRALIFRCFDCRAARPVLLTPRCDRAFSMAERLLFIGFRQSAELRLMV
jgi:hypothetical protein